MERKTGSSRLCLGCHSEKKTRGTAEWARNHAGGEEEGRGEIKGDGGGTQVSARDGEERAGAKGTGEREELGGPDTDAEAAARVTLLPATGQPEVTHLFTEWAN